MPIDYSVFAQVTGGLPKGTPREYVKHRKAVEKQSALDKCYAKVDARDNGISWVSGKQLVKSDRNHDTWLTRHHLDGREGEALTGVHGIITCSWTEHRYLQSSALLPVTASGRVTKDARSIARFEWNRRVVPAGKEPFRVGKRA